MENYSHHTPAELAASIVGVDGHDVQQRLEDNVSFRDRVKNKLSQLGQLPAEAGMRLKTHYLYFITNACIRTTKPRLVAIDDNFKARKRATQWNAISANLDAFKGSLAASLLGIDEQDRAELVDEYTARFLVAQEVPDKIAPDNNAFSKYMGCINVRAVFNPVELTASIGVDKYDDLRTTARQSVAGNLVDAFDYASIPPGLLHESFADDNSDSDSDEDEDEDEGNRQ